MTTPTRSRVRPVRVIGALALAGVGGLAGLLASPWIADAAGSAGYGYGTSSAGYGYGYSAGGSVNNFIGSALSSQAVVAAIPAGVLLAAAAIWERRRQRSLLSS